jgi:plastocyanin
MRGSILALVLAVAGCTPGGVITGGGGGVAAQTITVNLTLNAPTQTPAGTSGGFSPAITNVAVGSTINFINTDSFAHTATFISATASTFPTAYPFNASALTRTGTVVSQFFTSGALQPNQTTQTITIDKPGTYLYGCFFHYGSPMRGIIVAQ